MPRRRPTLDQVAAHLMQLEASDDDGRARMRRSLQALATDKSLGVEARTRCSEAEALLAPNDDLEVLDAALVTVGQLIEAAMMADAAPPAKAKRATPARAVAVVKAAARVVAAPAKPSEPPVTAAPAAVTPVTAPPAAKAPVASTGPSAADLALPADIDLEILGEFILESRENLAASETALLALERDPQDAEAVNTVFRAFHTIKGTCGFLGLRMLTGFAHKAESLLSKVRDRVVPYSPECADLALRAVDLMKEMIDDTERAKDGAPLHAPVTLADLESALIAATEGGLAAAVPSAPVAAPPVASAPADAPASRPSLELPVARASVELPAARPSMEMPAPRASQEISVVTDQPGAQAETSVRVRTERLDQLVDMVGELVIAQSMVEAHPTVQDGAEHDLNRKVAHAAKIVRELQDLAMALRMVPLRPTFQKLARLVRDTSIKSQKQVEYVTAGEDTEIDRTLVDFIADPLMHMIRNAVDHGIEPPAERAQQGKAPRGTVSLSASHAGGYVVVELRDDGRGLDRGRIVRKAVERGLIESADGMSDADIYALIFAPGFSTAETVTDLSGRGVGMDVVKRNIEAARGHVEIMSEAGQGTTFTIRLPLTLAITDGMLIQVGEERYIVPTTHIHVTFRPEASHVHTVAGRGEMVALRGDVLPIVRLHKLFNVATPVTRIEDGLLMLVGDGERRTALLVDRLLGQQQVVAKALGDGVGRPPGISGGAVLGDGRIGLIIDVPGLVTFARTESWHRRTPVANRAIGEPLARSA
ncbi:MAG: chemotaxis protein CheA [Gemmatimonadetes bacterium]|nr:chemotaxis protein CheA [Gemmatimonadota bacterium]